MMISTDRILPKVTHVEQCTILATRPIMFVLLKRRLAPLLNGLPVATTISEPVVALLKTCVGAATSIIRVLSILHAQDVVGTSMFENGRSPC